MKSRTNLDHFVRLLMIAVVMSVMTKIFVFGPLGLAILAACAIAAYALM